MKEDEFFIIKGGDSLTKLFSLSKTELNNIKIYVISMRTITNYFNSYYSDDFSYPVTPYQFMEYTGIANILNDESHKEFEIVDYKDAMEQADIVTFLVAHKEFKNLDIETYLDFCGVNK